MATLSVPTAAGLETGHDSFIYNRIFDFERSFHNRDHVLLLNEWMRSNWHKSITFAVLYVFCVFGGQTLMRKKPPFDLRPALVLWNFMLATFSFAGFARVFPEFIYVLSQKGFEYSVCNNSNAYGVTGFWTYLFCLSKVPELFDTSFVVLRKRPVIFLHWFHHATVLIYAWYSYHELTASGRWFVVLNYAIHGFMYSYYALKAMRVDVPRQVAMMITLSQIIQMVIGCIVNYHAWNLKRAHRPCDVTIDNIKYSFLMYLLYFLLFAHFFLQAYILKKPKGGDSASHRRSFGPAPQSAAKEGEKTAPQKSGNLPSAKDNGLFNHESGTAAARHRKTVVGL